MPTRTPERLHSLSDALPKRAALIRPAEEPRTIRIRRAVLVYLGAGAAGTPLALLASPNVALILLIAIIAIMMVALIVYEGLSHGHPLGPAGILGLAGLFLFGIRPVTIIDTGQTSAGATADEVTFSSAYVGYAVQSALQVIAFYMVFGLVYFFLVQRRARAGAIAPKSTVQATKSTAPAPLASLATAGILLVAMALVALGAAGYLIISSGGVSAYITGLANRSSFLANRSFLAEAYLPLGIALFLYLLIRQQHRLPRTWNALALGALVVLVISAFVTGGRGPLLLGVALPLMLVNQLGPNKLSGRAIALLGSVLLLAGVVLSVLLRDNVYDQGASLKNLATDPVGTLLSRITGGTDARPFDSLILLNSVQDSFFRFQFGRTYAATATWFVPGALVGDKNGGNTWFTSTYLPRFYYPDDIETSISAIGEAFANFWWVGIVVVAAVVAYVAFRVTLASDTSSLTRRLIYVSATSIFFSFLRGDAFHNVSIALVTVVLCVVLGRMVVPREASLRTQHSRREKVGRMRTGLTEFPQHADAPTRASVRSKHGADTPSVKTGSVRSRPAASAEGDSGVTSTRPSKSVLPTRTVRRGRAGAVNRQR